MLVPTMRKCLASVGEHHSPSIASANASEGARTRQTMIVARLAITRTRISRSPLTLPSEYEGHVPPAKPDQRGWRNRATRALIHRNCRSEIGNSMTTKLRILRAIVRWKRGQPPLSARRALRITATSIDLLQQRSLDRRIWPAAAATIPEKERPMPDGNALQRDAACAARNAQRPAAVEAVDQQHHVRRLGRGGGAAGAHRDADVGGGERRRVVDAVADHHHRAVLALGEHRERPSRRAERSAGRPRTPARRPLRPPRAVAGGQNDALDAERAQARQKRRRAGAQRVRQHQHARPVRRPPRPATVSAPGSPRRPQMPAASSPSRAATKFEPPTATGGPRPAPPMPAPATPRTAVGEARASPRSRASARWPAASTCWDAWSSEAARRSNFVGVEAAGRPRLRQPRPPVGERARSCRARSTATRASISSAAPPLTAPLRGGARQAGDQRDRHGEDQRAGGRDHQHRQRTHRVAREPQARRPSPASAAGSSSA